ncbi:putative NRPS-like protein biosynthetic cluster [Coccidioides posadasii str. Silveira]|uniref:Uncharacterized protein n=2 Tax=Coccidioides posadasii TaxID=199306 RepID=E9DJZ9_COCPS|nr:conserved hypothetical protein [Coccidioides posadasii str. Silveira]KMM70185.1 hypothetical protein CPAG_06497 [Coccidioides posadasii RMSCC 3488]QVM09343.1 putative NRPS-like protein biosynthetic cluster [Coccidioides posadasii str. Silveira]
MPPIDISSAVTRGQPPFTRPSINLDNQYDVEGVARSLPELVEFHARFNPGHMFCRQARKEDSNSSDYEFVNVDYSLLKQAILNCQEWLRATVAELQFPCENENYTIIRGPPIALFMSSHVTLVIYIFALMGMGVPVVLLSTRLSPMAINHLLGRTASEAILVSPRLNPVVQEAAVLHITQKMTRDDGQSDHVSLPPKKHTVAFPSQYNPPSFDEIREEVSREPRSGTIIHPLHYISEADCNVLVLHSSGSTGLPKPIYTSHRHYFSFALCHELSTHEEILSPTMSTSPLFHGFGLLPPCLSLGIGKPFCLPPSEGIPTGLSAVQLLHSSGAKSLLTVPSILEEIASLPEDKGLRILQSLHFVAFGGGLPKETVCHTLSAAGVRLVNHYGTTETGPLAPLYVPPPGYDWHYFKFRTDIRKSLRVQFSNCCTDNVQSGNHLQLSLQPLGWLDRFHVQDILVKKPNSETEFSILGRSDDLICLATGEKVRPTILETALLESPTVKAALAFGDGRFEIGVLVEPVFPVAEGEFDQFKSSLWPTIEKANQQMDSHARISSPTALVIVAPGSLPRSDKGTIIRREAHQQFEKEILKAYDSLETTGANFCAATLETTCLESGLRALIRENLTWKVSDAGWNDDTDFFELGMDSLQATMLRRFVIAALPDDLASFRSMDRDFLYRHSSISKLARALRKSDASFIEKTTDVSNETLEAFIDQFGLQRRKDLTILLTGSNGSLGAHLLAHLAKDPSVFHIICLNRPSMQDPYERQQQSLRSKGLSLSEREWEKIRIYQSNSSLPQLGLPEKDYMTLQEDVTHIIHNAWPMNFKMGLSSFEPQFRTLQNLLLLARGAHSSNPSLNLRVLFISSISVVGRYGEVYNEAIVPEAPIRDFNASLHLGYAKAKLVCEQIIERTRACYPEIELAYVRAGQIAGSSMGYWNKEEHFVALVASSQKIGKLPNLNGTLSWLPVDVAAAVISDILLSSEPMQLVYHLENPFRQSWREVLDTLAVGLNLGKDDRLSFHEWIDAVESAPDKGNRAKQLASFFKEDFERMSGGSLMLGTETSQRYSPTLRKAGTVTKEIMQQYLAYWKSIEVIS